MPATNTVPGLSGRITNSQGRPLRGASITAMSADGNIVAQVRSNRAGTFAIANLMPGEYTIIVVAGKHPNFTQAVSIGDAPTRLEVKLQDFPQPAGKERPTGYAGARMEAKGGDVTGEFVSMPDRWRIGFPPYARYGKQKGEYPYSTGAPSNPYKQNVLKADYPIIGQHTFLNLTLASDTIYEARRVPTPSNVSSAGPGSFSFFGRGGQGAVNQNFLMSAELFGGYTSFKPKDWAFRITPVGNINYLGARETGVVNIDVREGTNRTDGHVGLQEMFAEAKLRDVSANYDFISARAGIQGFNSDFRGFLFADNQLGLRIFGNSSSNRNQWNVAWFPALEKDTNSGLNKVFKSRQQNVFVANYYRQDFLAPGYAAQWSLHFNDDRPSTHYDENGFLVRPTTIATARPHHIRAGYVGWTGEGHIRRWNVSHAFYQALGHDSLNQLAGRKVTINAQMAALEASYDRDWLRLRGSLFYASGDRDPADSRGGGFDAIFDSPNFAGGAFSFWNRQAVRLTGTGVELVGRDSVLPTLRSSKIEGQANFVNPGVFILNGGIDADLTPKLRASLNANYLRFANTRPLEVLLNQAPIRREIGLDIGFGVRYRPHLNDNWIVTGGLSALLPGEGFRDIYVTRRALLATFLGVTFTY